MTEKAVTVSLPVDFWRSLRYFNLYRLILASFFLFLTSRFGVTLDVGVRDKSLFLTVAVTYAVVVLLSFIPIQLRWPRFTWQLAWLVGGDIVGLTVLAYASGEFQSNLGLLLLISLAAAGLISRGTITLFFAALASIAALLEHTYVVLYANADAAQYVQVGLLCMAYFAVAWLTHALAKYAVDSQQLAQRRGRDLVSLSEASRLVMRDMQDGVLVVDGQGMITQMNLRAERLLRKSITTDSALSETFPILYGQYAIWKQTGSASRDTLQLGMGMQAKLRFVPIEHEAARGAVIFLEDMHRVRAAAQQIKLAALGRLTANIAHEVRNPLSAISYATELLQEESGDAKQQRLLQIVHDNTQRINQIVQDVMGLNRRDRVKAEIFNLDAALHTLIEEFVLTERLEPGMLVLSVVADTEVSFDRGHLRQVLWNLCRNALRYCQKLPGSLRVAMSSEDGRVALDVQDDGPGISVENRKKLFEPFFTTAEEGAGLGLYIAKELCEANGALLEYRSGDRRTGARFRILFGERH